MNFHSSFEISASMEGTGKKGRRNRSWLDDLQNWTQLDFQKASHITQGKQLWRSHIQKALDTYDEDDDDEEDDEDEREK